MLISAEDTIYVVKDLYLDDFGWRTAFPSDGSSAFLPAGPLQFNYIHWTEGPYNDVDPAFGFKMMNRIEDKNYPEFSLQEIKEFLKNGTMVLIKGGQYEL